MKDCTRVNRLCRSCKIKTNFLLHVQIMQSGAKAFLWVCQTCGLKNPGGGPYYLSGDKVRESLSDAQIDSLPVILPDCTHRCVVCGNRNAELHHWAPKGIFGNEAGKWPKDYLCKVCHDLWHSKVTPGLVKEANP